MTKKETRACPFCKEEIKSGAVICKHCYTDVVPALPDHEGVCPFCKEDVNPEAIKCKYCGSQIGATEDTTIQSLGWSCPCQDFTSDSADLEKRSPVGQDCYYLCMEMLRHIPRRRRRRICQRACKISMPPLR